MVGTKGAKRGAVRLGCGIAGATLMAVALPVSTGWGAIGSPSPKPAEAAAICNFNRAFAKGTGDRERSTLVPVNGSSRNCLVGVDETSGAIVSLQDQLNRCNGADLDLDGIYGPKTRGTVVRIQRDAGIATDGIYGPQTAEAMKWSFTDSHGRRSCETLSGTRLIALH